MCGRGPDRQTCHSPPSSGRWLRLSLLVAANGNHPSRNLSRLQFAGRRNSRPRNRTHCSRAARSRDSQPALGGGARHRRNRSSPRKAAPAPGASRRVPRRDIRFRPRSLERWPRFWLVARERSSATTRPPPCGSPSPDQRTDPHHPTQPQNRSRPGIRVHRARALDPSDVRHQHRIPITAPTRTLIDLAQVLSPGDLHRAYEDAHIQRLVQESDLRSAVDRSPGSRGAAALRALLDRVTSPL